MKRVFVVLRVGLTGLCMIALFSTLSAQAAPDHPLHRVTICHATNSENNPYVQLTVDVAAVDGQAGNDNGNGDHLLNHTGPVFNPATPVPGWGDIIPPFYSDGLTPTGLPSANWDDVGQPFFNNGCNTPSGEGTDVCPNLPGNQPYVPEGYVLDELGNCVPG